MTTDTDALVATVRELVHNGMFDRPNRLQTLAALDALAAELKEHPWRVAAVDEQEKRMAAEAELERYKSDDFSLVPKTEWERVKSERDTCVDNYRACSEGHVKAVHKAQAAEARLDKALAALREIVTLPSAGPPTVDTKVRLVLAKNLARSAIAEIEGEA